MAEIADKEITDREVESTSLLASRLIILSYEERQAWLKNNLSRGSNLAAELAQVMAIATLKRAPAAADLELYSRLAQEHFQAELAQAGLLLIPAQTELEEPVLAGRENLPFELPADLFLQRGRAFFSAAARSAVPEELMIRHFGSADHHHLNFQPALYRVRGPDKTTGWRELAEAIKKVELDGLLVGVTPGNPKAQLVDFAQFKGLAPLPTSHPNADWYCLTYPQTVGVG